jgi:hypothetical protein
MPRGFTGVAESQEMSTPADNQERGDALNDIGNNQSGSLDDL